MKQRRTYATRTGIIALAAIFSFTLAACGGGGGGGTPPPPPPVTYSQADLAGTWHFNKLDAGVGSKWDRGKIVVDSGGLMTFTVFESSKAGDTAPTGLAVAIDSATGVIRIKDLPYFHGAMSTDKKIVIATIREPGAPSLLIMQKAVANVTFSAADLVNKSFVYHHVKAGAENDCLSPLRPRTGLFS